jgi:hypothetical protein
MIHVYPDHAEYATRTPERVGTVIEVDGVEWVVTSVTKSPYVAGFHIVRLHGK